MNWTGWWQHALAGMAVALPCWVVAPPWVGLWVALVVGIAHEQAQHEETLATHAIDVLTFLPAPIIFWVFTVVR